MASLTGSFLVARPVLQDPNFVQTVVMLLRHGPEGAFGLVVNRPAEVAGELPFPVHSGGPCPAPGLIMLHGHADWASPAEEDDESPEVAPGVFIGDADCVGRVGGESEQPLRFRMFVGYAGWGPDQLERELTEHTWHVVPATAELLFDTPPAELWDRLAPPAAPVPSVN
jgi:putative transcriptional regulator